MSVRNCLIFLLYLTVFYKGTAAQATDCERENGRHCHKWAQCERRQGDQRPRCYCSPGYGGDGYNCNQQHQQNEKSTDCERERGRHCHKWAQCERRQGDPRPRCYCSPGYGGDGYNCHRDDNRQNQGQGQVSTCSQPRNLEHGSFSASDGSYRPGTVLTYRCQDAYTIQGNSQRTCQQNGQWSGSQPRCERLECRGRCQRPQNIDGGTMSVSGCDVGNRVSYRCNNGMMLVGSTERSCKGDGQWSGTHPRCEKATDCERENGKHCHQWAQCERRQGDPKPRCYCSPGYRGDGYNCHEQGQDECQRKNHQTCHQHADCVRMNENKYVCRCRDGYKGDGVYCEGKGCSRPPGLTNGKLLSNQKQYVRGNVITYQCDRGYKLLGDSQRTCRDDGQWSGAEPRCEKQQQMTASCHRPRDIQHGSIVASDWNFPVGSTVTYQCSQPYKIDGNSQRTCQNNGQWSGNSPICKRTKGKRQRCQRPQDIPHGRVQPDESTYKPKTMITYQCTHPFTLVGNSQRTCLKSGQWSGTVPRCQDNSKDIKTCQRPSEQLPHGRIVFSDGNLKPGTFVTFECENGWRLQGNSQRTCQNDGRWSGNQPRCEKTQSPQDACYNSCHVNADCIVKDNDQGKCECRPPFYGDGYYCRGCEGGQIYKECVTICPPTCDNLKPDCETGCDPNNKCVCPEGKIQRSTHDKTCVDASQCR